MQSQTNNSQPLTADPQVSQVMAQALKVLNPKQIENLVYRLTNLLEAQKILQRNPRMRAVPQRNPGVVKALFRSRTPTWQPHTSSQPDTPTSAATRATKDGSG
jgi:hypothetical protein